MSAHDAAATTPGSSEASAAPSQAGAGINLASGYVPVLIVVSALIGTAFTAFQVGGIVQGYAQDRVENGKRFGRIEADLTEIRRAVGEMRELQRTADAGVFRRRDFDLWCREGEKENKGWKCPSL
jgi:hypothetical protein